MEKSRIPNPKHRVFSGYWWLVVWGIKLKEDFSLGKIGRQTNKKPRRKRKQNGKETKRKVKNNKKKERKRSADSTCGNFIVYVSQSEGRKIKFQ